MRPLRTPLRLALVTLLGAAMLGPAAAADASTGVKVYRNCTAIHAVYSGGIAKSGVRVNTVRSGGHTYYRALKGHVEFSTALYNANKKYDRDRDGIACEKS